MICEIESYGQSDASCFDGFVFSYTIPQIGKEFDLLSLRQHGVVNVEIKSQHVAECKIEKQLRQNYHYLKFLDESALCYCFESEEGCFYTLKNGVFTVSNLGALVASLRAKGSASYSDYDDCFEPSNYLISPINDVDAFLSNEYFLTGQQTEVENKILASEKQIFKITGAAGTGKSLLLYDAAKKKGSREKSALIIHCGKLSEGHKALNARCPNINIVEPRFACELSFMRYSSVFVDEAHRMYPWQFDIVANMAREAKIPLICALDPRQSLSKREIANNIDERLDKLPDSKFAFSMTEKIRCNREIAHFIKRVMNFGERVDIPLAGNTEILYAQDDESAIGILRRKQNIGYKVVSISRSLYRNSQFDVFDKVVVDNSHGVIGQEFDSVVVALPDGVFFYRDDGRLDAIEHPNPDYLTVRLLFQAMTRARNRLSLVIVADRKLFLQMVQVYD